MLTVLNVLFWGVAGLLIFIGAWIYSEYNHYEKIAESVLTLVPATILMAMGVFLFLLGIVGCIGAFKEQKCLLGFYFTMLLLILVGMLAGAILAYIYRDRVDSSVQDGIQQGLDNYEQPHQGHWTDDMDFMQSHLQCCGLNNYTDWLNTTWHNTTKLPYPQSCCENETCHYNAKNDTGVYEHGCYQKLKNEFKSHLGIVAGVAVAWLIVQILGMIFSAALICVRKREVPYIGLNDPDGMRV